MLRVENVGKATEGGDVGYQIAIACVFPRQCDCSNSSGALVLERGAFGCTVSEERGVVAARQLCVVCRGGGDGAPRELKAPTHGLQCLPPPSSQWRYTRIIKSQKVRSYEKLNMVSKRKQEKLYK
jgi:hypothetical protein